MHLAGCHLSRPLERHCVEAAGTVDEYHFKAGRAAPRLDTHAAHSTRNPAGLTGLEITEANTILRKTDDDDTGTWKTRPGSDCGGCVVLRHTSVYSRRGMSRRRRHDPFGTDELLAASLAMTGYGTKEAGKVVSGLRRTNGFEGYA